MPAGRTWTILDLVNEATTFFQGRGIESPRVNAEALLGHALGLARVHLYTQFDRPVDPEPLAAFRDLVRKRLERVPLQYLTGQVEFWSRTFAIRPGVFIPRPETEVLVERALEAVRGAGDPDAGAQIAGADTPRSIAEIGVGSGAVLVTLLSEMPGAAGIGTDVSKDALSLARENAERHGVLDRIDFREGSLLDPLEGATFDLIVANPPYLAESIASTLAPEIREHEPPAALYSGSDGFEALRPLVAGAWRLLGPRGVLALEIGDTQGAAALNLIASHGAYDDVLLAKDYAGRDRVVVARRAAG